MSRLPAFALPFAPVLRPRQITLPTCVASPPRRASHVVHASPASVPAAVAAPSSLSSRVAALPPAEGSVMVELLSPHECVAERGAVVVNRDGKRASFRIYEHVARNSGGVFGREAAREALNVYGDVAFEAIGAVGSHPAIDWLLSVVSSGREFVVKIDGKYIAGQ